MSRLLLQNPLSNTSYFKFTRSSFSLSSERYRTVVDVHWKSLSSKYESNNFFAFGAQFAFKVSEIPEPLGIKIRCWCRVEVNFWKVTSENKFFKLIHENFELLDLTRLFSSIFFSTVSCLWFLVLSVTLENMFLSFVLKGFLEDSAQGVEFIILQHNSCAYKATEIIDVHLRAFFQKHMFT